MADALRWYAARAKPGQERLALSHLDRQGFEAYFPVITIKRSKRGRIVRESEALFPGYVLIEFALDTDRWRAINGTRGIIRLLSFAENGTPSALPIGEIEHLRERERRGQLYISEVNRLRSGDRIKVKCGWATDQIGTVVYTRGERVKFLLTLLGRKVPVIAPEHALELVRRSKNRATASAVAFLPRFITEPARRP